VSGFLGWLARGIVRYRLFVLVGVLAVAAFLGAFIPRTRADFTPSDLFAHFEEQEQVAERFRHTFGNTDNIVLVMIEADSVLSRPVLQYVHDLSSHFRDVDFVARVDSVTATPIPRFTDAAAEGRDGAAGATPSLNELLGQVSDAVNNGLDNLDLSPGLDVDPVVEGDEVTEADVEELARALDDAPLLERRLIGADRRVTAVTLRLQPDVTRTEDILKCVAKIQSYVAAHPPPEGVRVEFGGLPVLRSELVTRMRTDQTILVPASLLVCFVILLAAFRRWMAVVLPLVAVATSAVILVGGMALVGEPFNIINNIVPMLVIIIGLSNAIHLIARYQEELAQHPEEDRQDASRLALRQMAWACFLTSFTTAIGFGSLALSQTEILRRFGITAAIGVMIAYLVTITFIPASLAMGHRKRRRRPRITIDETEWVVTRVVRGSLVRPWIIIGAAAALMAVCVVGALRLNVDNSVLDQFDPEDPLYRSTRLIERSLSGVRPLEVTLKSDQEGRFDEPEVLNAMTALQHWAEEQDGVINTLSYADYLHEAWYFQTRDPSRRSAPFGNAEWVSDTGKILDHGVRSPVAAFVTPDRREARVNIQLIDRGAQATVRFAERLQKETAELLGPLEGVDVQFTGDAYIGSRGLDIVIRDMLVSLLTAIAIIFGLLTVLFRSVRLGLLSLPPNILPLVVTMAFMYLEGIPLNAGTVIIFSISIGLAVDGTIHVLARFCEEIQRGRDVDEALLRAARVTGKAIVLTCVSLMLGFGVMLLSKFLPVRRFGQLFGITIFGCLIATLTVLPPLLRVGARPTRSEAEPQGDGEEVRA
jgi:predicted RND superfamily exporter protein